MRGRSLFIHNIDLLTYSQYSPKLWKNTNWLPSLSDRLIENQNLFCSTVCWFHCFHCSVSIARHGRQVLIANPWNNGNSAQTCKSCKGFTWRSQPLVWGKYPAGNILLSFATLMSGSSISKVLPLFRHMGLKIYCARTFFYHQRKFMFLLILHCWEKSRTVIID
jgi:hypothetical protein